MEGDPENGRGPGEWKGTRRMEGDPEPQQQPVASSVLRVCQVEAWLLPDELLEAPGDVQFALHLLHHLNPNIRLGDSICSRQRLPKDRVS